MHIKVHEASHMFSWGWRKLELISASAPLLQLGAQNTRQTLNRIARVPAPRRASTHIFLGDFGSGVLIFGRLEAIHAELLAARLNLPGVSVLWWSRRVRLNECVSCDAERRSTNHRLSLQALQQTTPSIYIVCVCQIKTRPGSVVSAYSYIQACTTPI